MGRWFASVATALASIAAVATLSTVSRDSSARRAVPSRSMSAEAERGATQLLHVPQPLKLKIEQRARRHLLRCCVRCSSIAGRRRPRHESSPLTSLDGPMLARTRGRASARACLRSLADSGSLSRSRLSGASAARSSRRASTGNSSSVTHATSPNWVRCRPPPHRLLPRDPGPAFAP